MTLFSTNRIILVSHWIFFLFQMWGKNRGAVERFQTRREALFDDFKSRSAPASLVNNPRIVKGNETAEQIETTFNEILKLDLIALKCKLQAVFITFSNFYSQKLLQM